MVGWLKIYEKIYGWSDGQKKYMKKDGWLDGWIKNIWMVGWIEKNKRIIDG